MNSNDIHEIIIDTLNKHGQTVKDDKLWNYFEGDESQEEIDKFVNLFVWIEQEGYDVMTMARICIYLANPCFVNCCDEMLKAMEGRGELE